MEVKNNNEKTNFFKTKAGGLTIAFLVIMVAFVIILMSAPNGNLAGCSIGFILIVGGMLYSPVKVQIIDRIRGK